MACTHRHVRKARPPRDQHRRGALAARLGPRRAEGEAQAVERLAVPVVQEEACVGRVVRAWDSALIEKAGEQTATRSSVSDESIAPSEPTPAKEGRSSVSDSPRFRTLGDVVEVKGAGGDEDQGGDPQGRPPEVAEEEGDGHLPAWVRGREGWGGVGWMEWRRPHLSVRRFLIFSPYPPPFPSRSPSISPPLSSARSSRTHPPCGVDPGAGDVDEEDAHHKQGDPPQVDGAALVVLLRDGDTMPDESSIPSLLFLQPYDETRPAPFSFLFLP